MVNIDRYQCWVSYWLPKVVHLHFIYLLAMMCSSLMWDLSSLIRGQTRAKGSKAPSWILTTRPLGNSIHNYFHRLMFLIPFTKLWHDICIIYVINNHSEKSYSFSNLSNNRWHLVDARHCVRLCLYIGNRKTLDL